jgi:hypothetical protein
MRTRLSIASTPILAALAGVAILVGACASSSDDVTEREELDAGGDTGRGSTPERDADPNRETDAGRGAADADAGSDADADAADAPITITGRVVGVDGEALANVGVSIAGKPIVQTGADGSFTVAGIKAPYDLTLVGSVGTIKVVHTFIGLSTATPRLVPASALDAPTTKLHATVSGSIGTVPAGQLARVCIEGVDQRVYGCTVVYEGGSDYSIDATWLSAATVSVRVRALRYAINSVGAITDFTGTGSKDATLTSGAASTVDVSLGAAPAKASLGVKLTPPAGGTTSGIGIVFAKVGPWLSFPLEVGPTDAIGRTFAVPVFPNVTYSAIAMTAVGTQQISGWEVGLAAGATANPKLVSPPTLTAPAEGAIGVTHTTKFEVDNPGNIPLMLFCAPRSANPLFAVSTTSASITLPDLSGINLPLPKGTQYGCSLLPVGEPGAGPDSLAAGDGPIGAFATMQDLANGGPSFASNGSLVVIGEERLVTTEE